MGLIIGISRILRMMENNNSESGIHNFIIAIYFFPWASSVFFLILLGAVTLQAFYIILVLIYISQLLRIIHKYSLRFVQKEVDGIVDFRKIEFNSKLRAENF